MLTRDYYVILGVSRDENPEGIRRAFRNLVKRYHPDIVGPGWVRRFQEILEAYEVLSDPERRRWYNKGLEQARTGPRHRMRTVVTGYGNPPEPLVPEPVSVLGLFPAATDSFAALIERFYGNFHDPADLRGQRPRSLSVEVLLSPGEAWRGSRLPIDVPTIYPCPDCSGDGGRGLWACPTCRGRGLVQEPDTIWLSIPPGVRNGEVFDVPLQGMGVHNLYLRVKVIVAHRAMH